LVGTADGALDETVGVRLGSIHLGILAGVLEALVPAEICGLISMRSKLSATKHKLDIPISK